MKECPFRQRAIDRPEHLIGHKAFLQRIDGGLAMGPVLMAGARRNGKSSVLKVYARTRSESRACFYVDAQALPSGGGLGSIAERIVRRYGLDVDPDGSFEAFVGRLLEREVERQGDDEKARVLLLIDEFDALTRKTHATCFEYGLLRAILQEEPRFSILAASSVPALQIDMAGSDLLNFWLELRLPPLEIENGLAFYEAYLAAHGAQEWFEDRKDLLTKAAYYAGRHPWLLQLAGAAAWMTENGKEDYFRTIVEQEGRVQNTLWPILDRLEEIMPSDLDPRGRVRDISRRRSGAGVLYALGARGLDEALDEEYAFWGLVAGEEQPGAFASAAEDWLAARFGAATPTQDNVKASLAEARRLIAAQAVGVAGELGFLRGMQLGLLTVDKDGRVVGGRALLEGG